MLDAQARPSPVVDGDAPGICGRRITRNENCGSPKAFLLSPDLRQVKPPRVEIRLWPNAGTDPQLPCSSLAQTFPSAAKGMAPPRRRGSRRNPVRDRHRVGGTSSASLWSARTRDASDLAFRYTTSAGTTAASSRWASAAVALAVARVWAWLSASSDMPAA